MFTGGENVGRTPIDRSDPSIPREFLIMATRGATRIEPVPQKALDDLRERLQRTRFPEAETSGAAGSDLDWSQGPPLAYVEDLVGYWAESYDWRRLERELDAHGQARRTIDGLD